ncbi:response regulator [Methylocystis sp. WRRC1]|uniref:response regulator n=1 Tax=Methylocystis sp. WRRC1 TaxID=1732014 RepID=UPI001D132D28|nr:response regulator [Methylocystis sp. WRRC1]MCC3247427.1 response regulator [Methylocystis sp. WRRC1]
MHKVMVVDDSAMMRVVISNFVSSLPNYKVVAAAENGRKALEQLAKFPDLSLILLDIEMPEMNGLEFLRHAKLKSRAKIVILSSVAAAGSRQASEARSLGADAIVTKPSGAVSMDLADKRGAELARVMSSLAPA